MQSPYSISIITICFNCKEQLRRTIASVSSQTYPEVEYIVVDGGSTDGSLQIIEEAHQAGIVTRYISEPDHGIYDAMNKGLRMATMDYLCFMNAGDTFHSPETLSKALGAISPNSYPTVIYGETNLVDHEGQFIKRRELRAPKKLTASSFRKGMLVCHQSFYALRSRAPLYDESYRFSADYDWCLKILEQPGCTTHNTQLVLTDYLHEGLTTQNRWVSLKERFEIMKRHYGILPTLLSHLYFLLRYPFK
ncbi:MAG: glycosyltransferase family 2 protein [Porphyromonas sp.]|nr:glycosyltransferase family 2 protein [Porphyromonas sp.]